MNKRIFILLLLLTLFIVPKISFASHAGKGTISGVIDYQGDKTGKIIIATLIIPPDFDHPLRLDTLDTPGCYEITELDDGTYFIGAYMDANANDFPGFDEPVGLFPAPITIENAEYVNDIDFAIKDLPRGTGSISGTINYVGAMTGEVHVYVLGLTRTPFVSDHFTWGENNTFSIDGLFDGNYLIVAFIDENGNQLPELNEPLGAVENLILLEDGEDVTGVEVTLFDPLMYNCSISGTASYSGPETGDIHVLAAGLTFTPITDVIVDEFTGDYEIPDLSFGEYYLFSYMDLDSNGTYDLGEPFSESYLDNVFLGMDEDTIGIDFYLVDQGTGAISGTVSYNGPQHGFIAVAAAGLSATPLGITLNFFPGPYLIPNLAPGIYAVGGFMDIDQDMMPSLEEPLGIYLDDFLHLEQGDTITGVDFTLEDSTNGAIAGNIYAPDGVSGEVFIFSLGLSISPFKKLSVPDAGPYQISEVGAGKYIVAAFMDINGDSTYSVNEPVGITQKLINVAGHGVTENVDIYLSSITFTDTESEPDVNVPKDFALLPNYPNPFNPTTTLEYQVPKASHVTIKVYNLLGEEISTLIDEEIQPGNHQLTWDAKNVTAQNLSSGIYICRMQTDGFVESRKMTLIR